MDELVFEHAAAICIRPGPFERFVVVENKKKPPPKRRYYTGNHASPETIWTRDFRLALLYAHWQLAVADSAALSHGRLPEGRRDHIGGESFIVPPPKPEGPKDIYEGL